MADAAVEFLLLNLKQLLMYNAKLISGAKEQVEALYNELIMLKAFLKDSIEKHSEYGIVKALVRQIRVVVYEAEDVIVSFVVQTALQRGRSTLAKVIHHIDYPAKLCSVAKRSNPSGKKVDTGSNLLALESLTNVASLLAEFFRRKRLRWRRKKTWSALTRRLKCWLVY